MTVPVSSGEDNYVYRNEISGVSDEELLQCEEWHVVAIHVYCGSRCG